MFPHLNEQDADAAAKAQHDIRLIYPNRQVSVLSSASRRSQMSDEGAVIDIFDQYDTNKDGFLDTKEIKAMIRARQADDIEASVVKKILKLADEDNDGLLSKAEFIRMHRRNRWVLKDMTTKYANIVPFQASHKITMRPKHKPWLMLLLTLVQFGLAIYNNEFSSANSGGNKEDSPQTSYNDSRLFQVLIFEIHPKTQVWRFITYMLVHTEWFHLVGNMVLQLLLGVPLEIYNGWWRVLVVYLAGGVAGCLGHAVFQDRSLRGASAGDFALLTAHIASVVINWRELEHGLIQIFLSLLYCIISFIVAVTDFDSRVSHVSHFFGGFAGLLVGFCVLQNLVTRKWEETLKIVSMAIFSVLMLGAGIYFYAAR